MIDVKLINHSYCYDWVIISKNTNFSEEGFNLVYNNSFFNFYTNAPIENISDNTLIIFGLTKKKINTDSNEFVTEKIKGYYSYVHLNGDEIIVANDFFGVSKFFYNSNNLLITSRFDIIIKYTKPKIINENVILFLLFNYNVLGTTFYEHVFYSEPNTKFIINKNNLQVIKNKTRNKTNLKKDVKDLSELWTKILNDVCTDKRVGLTLTGGYDSRLILGGLLKDNIKPLTFTFGEALSDDAITANYVAKKIGVDYKVIPFDYCDPQTLDQRLKQMFMISGGLINPFRTIRLKAVREISDECDIVLLGYAGSEILRGIFPDGLLVSDFYTNFLKNKEFSISNINEYLKRYYVNFSETEIQNVNNLLSKNASYFNQYEFMINVILPMHFGEDLRFFLKTGIDCYAPFMDEDFFDYALLNGFVPLAYEKQVIKDNHFKRIDNPRVSAKILKHLNSQLMHLKLNRGYTPNDYLISKYYAGLKLIFKKRFLRKGKPVTQLNPWLINYFKTYLSFNDIAFLNDKHKLIENLYKNPESEYDFLPWVKLWLVNETLKTLKDEI